MRRELAVTAGKFTSHPCTHVGGGHYAKIRGRGEAVTVCTDQCKQIRGSYGEGMRQAARRFDRDLPKLRRSRPFQPGLHQETGLFPGQVQQLRRE